MDGIVLRGGSLLLVRRRYPPFEGRYALPGGMVETGETVERAVVREVREETGLRTAVVGLVGVYSDPRRDPRGHVISVVFRLRLAGGSLRARSDASDASFHPLDDLPRLAFDHARIVRDVVRFQRTSEGNRRRTSRRRG